MRALFLLLALLASPFALTAASRPHLIRDAALVHFIDRIVARDRAAYHVPGIAFVMVKGDHILFAHGYGYANLAHHTPVIPDQTIFRLGPVSAVVTTAAVLQLAARGKVDLHANVNRYLAGFQLAATFPRPVTPADLLTNTGGFEVRHIGRRTLSSQGLQPLGAYLASAMPPRVDPPGRVYSYSTYGFTLAGYLVQTVSHTAFSRYVAEHIFRPLGMQHSTFQQLLPRRLLGDSATGYDVSGSGSATPSPHEYFNVAPGSGMEASAADMARFMGALLRYGRYHRHRILPPAMVQAMERQQLSSYPQPPGYPSMPGVAYGFGRYYQNGQLLIEHTGAVRGFSSLLALLPQHHLGLFIAGNTARDSYLFDLQRRLLDHYYPAGHHQAPHRPYPYGSIDRFVGTYWLDGYSRTTIEKLGELVNAVEVTAAGAHSLVAHLSSGPVHLTRVSSLLFQTGHGHKLSYWAFETDNHGRVTHLVTGGATSYAHVAWYNATNLQVTLVGGIVLVLLSGVVLWLIVPSAGNSRHDGRRALAGRLAGLTSALDLLFLIAMAAAMWSAINTQDEHYSWLEYGVPAWVYVLLTVPVLATILTVALIGLNLLAWRRAYWSILRRLHYTLVTLAAIVFILFLQYWNLLGYHF